MKPAHQLSFPVRRGLPAAFAAVCLAGLLATGPAGAGPEAEVPPAPDAGAGAMAADFLEFDLQDAALCYNLSPGGKMTRIRNTHPEHSIRYRLVRHFAGTPQAGRVQGVLAPDEEPRPIGCSQVDGHPQTWVVERARFD